MEPWSTHELFSEAEKSSGRDFASDLKRYAQRLRQKEIAVVFNLAHLAKITGVPPEMIRSTVDRRREKINYRLFAIAKRSGGRRFIHALSGDLGWIQRFINREILQKCQPHSASFAFHKSGGILKCASQHCGARWILQFDLSDFFFHVSELDIFRIFEELGYQRLLSFEFARLCSTTHLPRSAEVYTYHRSSFQREFPEHLPYRPSRRVGVLPQGGPSSPMLSNLAARRLDIRLSEFANENGMVYTRYADDLTFSSPALPDRRSIGSLCGQIVGLIRRSGFKENPSKTRIAGPGSKKRVLGLLVDGPRPRLSKELYNRVETHLYSIKKFGLTPAALHRGFESAFGYYNHVSGLITFIKDVDETAWEEFSKEFGRIEIPWATN